MEPLPASYYGKIDKKNPVISAFDGEIKEFKSCIKRIRDSPKFDYNTYVRGSKLLFEIWNKFKPRLPTYYYDQHVLQIADFLFSSKLYHLAQWQGYGRYLCEHGDVTVDSIKDVDHFKSALFPQGFNTDQAKLTFRALQGQCLCMFYLERGRGREPSLDSIQKLLSLLGFLRIMMQALLPQENLCWLIYNGSLYIYDICRYLMSVSRSAQALEYLLWACVCLETSIPLLSPRFLPWRATLYCAVCQCYYEGQAGVHAEVFARRALGKVSELANLENPADSPLSTEDQKAFKEAMIKLATMVFKRSVYEPRRKPKSTFRPKTKNCLKDASNMPWPRNHTERILVELFEGNAAQFLAVLEALWDSTRRPLQTGGPDEPDLMDVALELMAAGISILAGVGGSTDVQRNDSLPVSLNGVSPNCNLLDVAIAGGNMISVDAAVTFVKLLFGYEQWDMFKNLSSSLLTLLGDLQGSEARKAEVELTLLSAVDDMLGTQRTKHLPKESGPDDAPEKERLLGAMGMSQELMDLIEALHASFCESAEDIKPDGDLVMDLILFLWNKCKLAFQRAQVRHWDPERYLGKMENQDKWVKALFLLNEVAEAFNLAATDPVVVEEMTLRLALVLESSAENALNPGRTAVTPEGSSVDTTPVEKHGSSFSLVKFPAEQQLQLMYDVLERSLEAISDGNTRLLPCSGSAVCDMVFMQRFGGSAWSSPGGDEPERARCPSFTLSADVHVELLAFLHRAALKLATHNNQPESMVVEKIRKNKVSRALYLMQKALLQYRSNQSCTKKLLQEALSLVEKAEVEERRLYLSCTTAKRRLEAEKGSRVPPPPILLARTNHSMTFKPAPYDLEEQVCWYQILGREADGINLKVRLGDCHLLGTGVMMPVNGERLFRIEGLEHNQKYIFAVATYDAQGKIVGQSIGDSTKPILASAPTSLLMAWAHLAQAAYQTGQQALAKKACIQLWDHFTRPPPENTPASPHTSQPEGLAQTRLCVELLHLTSPLLHQYFFSSIFMQTEIHVQEGALFCDILCDQGPPIWGQKARLAECERMLVALDLALWLNDSSAALQAVVGCYGLLAPLIYHQIQSEEVLQILIKCLMVLQEISGTVRKKRNIETAESLQHMVACMTYYVVKALRVQKKTLLANMMIEQGKKLLLDITDKSLLGEDSKRAAGHQGDEDMNEILRSLDCMKLKKPSTSNEKSFSLHRGIYSHDLTGYEDPSVLYTVIETQNTKNAFREVMKFKRKPGYMDFVVLTLQKAMQEDQVEMVVQMGQEVLHWLGRRDEELVLKKANVIMYSETRKHPNLPGDHFKRKNSSWNEKREKELKKKLTALKAQKSEKECKAVDVLLQYMTLLVRRQQHRRRLRLVCSEEWVWRCHVNLMMARSHLTILQRSLNQQASPPQPCYSQLPSSLFSLAHCGTLVRWRSGPQDVGPPDLCVPTPPTPPASSRNAQQPGHKGSPKGTPRKGRNRDRWASNEEDSPSAESDTDHEPDAHRLQRASVAQSSALGSPRHPAPHQDALSKAALHLRRAMVLAHRGGHWTSLQNVCALIWDQACTLPVLLGGRSPDAPCCPGLDQLYTTLTPLLTMACELLMDMMAKLQLWKAYGEDERHLEASLHFSSTLDDSTRVDLRWLRSLLLHTLELLYYQAKWETLAHLALTYNHYTRERYTHMITPLLVYAQRRLLDRIAFFGGPPAPQPHYTQTTQITGERISCRNYVGVQVTCVTWATKTRLSSRKESVASSEINQMKRAMALVSVPLDVEETLCCFRESLEKGDHTLLNFQHSRTLLLLLLAHTQPGFEVPFCKDTNPHTPGRVEFSGMVYTPPSISPPDLSAEDFSSLNSICACPLPPSHMQTALSSLSTSAKHLQASSLSSLRAQTLHDLGNLHFYKGNRRAAQACWSKALDCALQGSGVLEAWDGLSWQGLSPQQILKQAGIWGCLQGALLTAKIAQYILTSDMSQRTKCCLLSAYLFKALLQASLPHPQANLQYSSYSIEGDLIPGLDLFGEPQRGSPGATVSSLGFLCHWLYAVGHHATVLPLLCLYLYFVGSVCKDPHLTVRGRILKVRALTELGMFSQALSEVSRLLNADDVPLPHSYNSSTGQKTVMKNKFFNSKPISDPANLQCLEELLNASVSSDVSVLYGPHLCQWLVLVRVHLLLALCEHIHNLPDPLGPEVRTSETAQPTKTEDSQRSVFLRLQKLTPGRVKALLLREACTMLDPVLRSVQAPPTDPEELELVVEAGLLQTDLYLQQGRVSASADEAVCVLRLLQESAVLQASAHSSPSPGLQSSVLRLRDSRQGQEPGQELGQEPGQGRGQSCSELFSALSAQLLDSPRAAEARERLGPSLWLRCRLAAVRSLVAHLPYTAISPGVDSSEEAECVLKEGLQEAEQLGCVETRAALLLLGVRLDTHRAQPREYSTVLLQEVVSLLSGRRWMSLAGCLTLARATLLLSDLRGCGGRSLLQLTQRLLQQQLTQLGESVDLGEGGRVIPPSAPGLSNTHHPQLTLLATTTFRLGLCLLTEASVKAVESGGEAGPSYQRALEVLRSAQHLCQALGSRQHQLEADVLYCMGLAERNLLTQSDLTAHDVAKTFLCSVNICMDHCPNLEHVQRCYLEMAGVYMSRWKNRTPDPAKSPSAPSTPRPKTPDTPKTSKSATPKPKTTASTASQKEPNRMLTDEEVYLLFSWVCLRAANETRTASANLAQLSATSRASGDDLPVPPCDLLPDFVSCDLLRPCGGIEVMNRDSVQVSMDTGSSQSQGSHQLSWVHLVHYHTHLTNLLSLSTCPVASEVYGGLMSLAEDTGLCLRLTQLEALFSSHLPSYRDTCTGPQPPSNFLLCPQLLQSEELRLCPDLLPWACAVKQELLIQWHHPTLDPTLSTPSKGQVLLYYGVNQLPLSAQCPTVTAVEGLRVGRCLVCLEKLRAVHAQLSAACVDTKEAATTPTPTPISTPTSTPTRTSSARKKDDKKAGAGAATCPKQQMLQERTKLCCTEIRRLLCPQSRSTPTEVPFDVSLQTLCALERCFNPAHGGTLTGKALVTWLLSLLSPPEGI